MAERDKEVKVNCTNCRWSWDLKDGGDDPFTCHKCGHGNSPEDLSEIRQLVEISKSAKEIINKLLMR